jgi:hypothetical protein
MCVQEDELILQVAAEKGEAAATEQSERRPLPTELPMPPSFKNAFCKPKSGPSHTSRTATTMSA